MDLIHTVLNLVALPFTFFSLLFLLPPFQLFKLFVSLFRYVFSENVAGKVVLITGASSGIGEHLAYEYARRGACLALCARRESRLREVADLARELGSPDVITVRADVSKVDDCHRFVHLAVHHFGRVDHLVNNAGVTQISLLEEMDDITNFRQIMDINFWGTVYTTRFAAPYLTRSGGKIVFLTSSASWMTQPRMSIYNASKAAMAVFAETMRIELGPEVHITLASPGFVETEITKGKFLEKGGTITVDPEMRDVQVGLIPVVRAESCAETIVNAVCRRQRYATDPTWFRVTYYWRLFFPELVEWSQRVLYMTSPGTPATEAPVKKILDFIGAQKVLYPETLQQQPQIKAE